MENRTLVLYVVATGCVRLSIERERETVKESARNPIWILRYLTILYIPKITEKLASGILFIFKELNL